MVICTQCVLRSWVHEPSYDRYQPGRLDKMIFNKDIDGVFVEMSYRYRKILDTICCPLELANVGMRGIFTFMRLGDLSGKRIYPEEAQLMVPVLNKVVPLIKDTEDFDNLQECVGQLRDMFAKCRDGYYIRWKTNYGKKKTCTGPILILCVSRIAYLYSPAM
ncbi:hypothetical protein BDP27DRAFT_162640 [Rhodocollybia butyracea]|uniref:Uncharacterized protein n=1 Tax=Rhodocollybia butyracea TaxID=206335 RepID=A0A9P5U3F0_9AGAR|nr:hypothetical protein BDP27DRAFT_162640 [Rhodocollybia butyracea]